MNRHNLSPKKKSLANIFLFLPHFGHLQQKEKLEFVKSKVMVNVGIIEYAPVDTGEELEEKTSPFDKFIQIRNEKAEIIVYRTSKFLGTGQSIIPVHVANSFKASNRFIMTSTDNLKRI